MAFCELRRESSYARDTLCCQELDVPGLSERAMQIVDHTAQELEHRAELRAPVPVKRSGFNNILNAAG